MGANQSSSQGGRQDFDKPDDALDAHEDDVPSLRAHAIDCCSIASSYQSISELDDFLKPGESALTRYSRPNPGTSEIFKNPIYEGDELHAVNEEERVPDQPELARAPSNIVNRTNGRPADGAPEHPQAPADADELPTPTPAHAPLGGDSGTNEATPNQAGATVPDPEVTTAAAGTAVAATPTIAGAALSALPAAPTFSADGGAAVPAAKSVTSEVVAAELAAVAEMGLAAASVSGREAKPADSPARCSPSTPRTLPPPPVATSPAAVELAVEEASAEAGAVKVAAADAPAPAADAVASAAEGAAGDVGDDASPAPPPAAVAAAAAAVSSAADGNANAVAAAAVAAAEAAAGVVPLPAAAEHAATAAELEESHAAAEVSDVTPAPAALSASEPAAAGAAPPMTAAVAPSAVVAATADVPSPAASSAVLSDATAAAAVAAPPHVPAAAEDAPAAHPTHGSAGQQLQLQLRESVGAHADAHLGAAADPNIAKVMLERETALVTTATEAATAVEPSAAPAVPSAAAEPLAAEVMASAAAAPQRASTTALAIVGNVAASKTTAAAVESAAKEAALAAVQTAPGAVTVTVIGDDTQTRPAEVDAAMSAAAVQRSTETAPPAVEVEQGEMVVAAVVAAAFERVVAAGAAAAAAADVTVVETDEGNKLEASVAASAVAEPPAVVDGPVVPAAPALQVVDRLKSHRVWDVNAELSDEEDVASSLKVSQRASDTAVDAVVYQPRSGGGGDDDVDAATSAIPTAAPAAAMVVRKVVAVAMAGESLLLDGAAGVVADAAARAMEVPAGGAATATPKGMDKVNGEVDKAAAVAVTGAGAGSDASRGELSLDQSTSKGTSHSSKNVFPADGETGKGKAPNIAVEMTPAAGSKAAAPTAGSAAGATAIAVAKKKTEQKTQKPNLFACFGCLSAAR